LGLWDLAQKIPEDWVDHQHGGRRGREQLHVTFLLRMGGSSDHLLRLERVCGPASPAELRVKEFFLEHVDRIREAEVYCIGVAFSSPALRALKNAWLQECDEGSRRVHDPYPESDGHVSLAYVHAWAWEEANAFVEENKALLLGRRFDVRAITYEDETRQRMELRLTGTEAPPAGGAAAAAGPLEIDGSVLEGGGQILRNSLGYSAILGYPVHIVKIRAGRKKPGLAAQHLESFKLVGDVSSGSIVGDAVGSNEVSFTPKQLREGSFSADPKTAGAITLMVQASLFPLAFAGGTSEVELRGGTDVDFSPPLDFLQRILVPTVGKMGVKVDLSCQQRGFFPNGGGHVTLFVTGLQGPLKPINISERGSVTRIEAVCYATPSDGWLDHELVRAVEDEFEPWLLDELADKGGKKPKVVVRCQAEAPPSSRAYMAACEIVVQTSGGGLFHGSAGPKEKPRAKNLYEVLGAAAEQALGPLKAQLRSGAGLDEHLLDQLILPASLAQGTSKLLGGKELSLHAQTAVHIAEKMVPGVRFSVTKPSPETTLVECRGVGRQPGAPPAAPPGAGAGGGAGGEFAAQLGVGALSYAEPGTIADLENDLRQFSQHMGVQARAEVATDAILIAGCESQDQADACRAELGRVFEFYGFPQARWGWR